jgi:hypothetical protein
MSNLRPNSKESLGISLNNSSSNQSGSIRSLAKAEFKVIGNHKLLKPAAYQNSFEPLPIEGDPYRGMKLDHQQIYQPKQNLETPSYPIHMGINFQLQRNGQLS